MRKMKLSFAAYLAIFQVVFIILFAFFGKYAQKPELDVYPSKPRIKINIILMYY